MYRLLEAVVAFWEPKQSVIGQLDGSVHRNRNESIDDRFRSDCLPNLLPSSHCERDGRNSMDAAHFSFVQRSDLALAFPHPEQARQFSVGTLNGSVDVSGLDVHVRAIVDQTLMMQCLSATRWVIIDRELRIFGAQPPPEKASLPHAHIGEHLFLLVEAIKPPFVRQDRRASPMPDYLERVDRFHFLDCLGKLYGVRLQVTDRIIFASGCIH